MKYICLAIVLFVEFLLYKFLNSDTYLVPVFILILIAGTLLTVINNGRSKFADDLGWGMIRAGLISILWVVGLVIWVFYNFSK